MKSGHTVTLKPDADGVLLAAKVLSGGGLVAFPTETVYGLGADARNDTAVAAIFDAKGRPSFNPLIVHVKDLETALKYCVFDKDALKLAKAFWPGAMTLVLPLRPDSGISKLVTAGLDTLGVRVPAGDAVQDLLAAFDGPMAGPSANPSGKISPTTADHVLSGLYGKIDAVLDAGHTSVGVESTIIGCLGRATALRAGGVPFEEIERVLGYQLGGEVVGKAPIAPGQLESHYAPKGHVRLNVTTRAADEELLGFGPVEGAVFNLSHSADLREAAANLFDYLHKFDERGTQKIAVSPIPNEGLGRAINDRLRRAAAPRGD